MRKRGDTDGLESHLACFQCHLDGHRVAARIGEDEDDVSRFGGRGGQKNGGKARDAFKLRGAARAGVEHQGVVFEREDANQSARTIEDLFREQMRVTRSEGIEIAVG